MPDFAKNSGPLQTASNPADDTATTHNRRLERRARAKSRHPCVGVRAGGAWSDDILQVWHEVEARIELYVIVRFQNYFVSLDAWGAVAQRQTEPGLQLLDLRQKRTYSPICNFKADLIFWTPRERTDVHKPQECKMLEQGNLW
jgi:hypothetical protein